MQVPLSVVAHAQAEVVELPRPRPVLSNAQRAELMAAHAAEAYLPQVLVNDGRHGRRNTTACLSKMATRRCLRECVRAFACRVCVHCACCCALLSLCVPVLAPLRMHAFISKIIALPKVRQHKFGWALQKSPDNPQRRAGQGYPCSHAG